MITGGGQQMIGSSGTGFGGSVGGGGGGGGGGAGGVKIKGASTQPSLFAVLVTCMYISLVSG